MKDRGTTKAKQNRKKLVFSQKHKSIIRSNPYKIIANWEEFNVGTEDVEFEVTLTSGHSYEKENHDNKRGFHSVKEAIIAVRNSFHCSCMFCCKPGK